MTAQELPRNCNKVEIQIVKVVEAEGITATIQVQGTVHGMWNQFFVVLVFDDYGLPRALAREDLKPSEPVDIDIVFPEGEALFPAKDVYDLFVYFVAIHEHRRDNCTRIIQVSLVQ